MGFLCSSEAASSSDGIRIELAGGGDYMPRVPFEICVFPPLLDLGVGSRRVRCGFQFNEWYSAPNPLFNLKGALFTLRGPSLGA